MPTTTLSYTNGAVPTQPTISVDYEEMADSPSQDVTSADGTHTGTRQFKVKWADRRKFVQQILGWGSLPILGLPAQFPGIPASFAKSCGVQPFSPVMVDASGDVGTAPNFQHALITVNYEAKTNSAQDSNAVRYEESLEPSAQFLTLDNTKMSWDNPQSVWLNDGEVPQKIIRMMDWTITIYNLTAIPGAIATAMGTVNQSAVTSSTLGYQFPAETLLYLGGCPSRSVLQGAGGQAAARWKISHKLTAKKDSWNLFYRRGITAPQKIYVKDPTTGTVSQYKPYDTTDFGGLGITY